MQPLRKNSGFTLVEIIVAITVISILLVFAIPNFQSFLTDTSKDTGRWIILTVKMLKQGAVQNRICYTLHVSMDENQMWYTDESADPEGQDMENPPNKYKLPENLKIIDVEYPGEEKITSGEATVDFYKKGFSDRAIIHIEKGEDKQYSFVIEAFLLKVKMYEKYIGFES